jgi:hypothetical protein
MGLLMAIWLSASAFCALFVMPSLIYVYRPSFIFGERSQASVAAPASACQLT